jgi:hypothetical protein
MADRKELNGADHIAEESGNGAIVLDNFEPADSAGVLHSYFALLALRHRHLLIGVSLLSMMGVFCLTRFVMHPKYQATAIIRPVGQNSGSLSGLLQSAGMSATFAGTGIDSDIGTNMHDPDELVTILNSYSFTTKLIEAENLGPHLTGGFNPLAFLKFFSFGQQEKGSPIWGYYNTMAAMFDCENSLRTGNITLTFINKDPEFAKRVVRLYIDHLRDELRTHDVGYDDAAAKSLQEAAAAASDPMLRDSLYALAAAQVQKTGTAEANADFAFTVLEKPYVPPYPVKPWVYLDTLAAGLAVPLFIYFILLVRDWTPRMKTELAAATSELEKIRNSIAVARKPRRIPTPQDDRPYTS